MNDEPAQKLLALETSSATGSIALGVGGHVLERTIAAAREQTARIVPEVEALLAEASLSLGELDAIVFGRGPGSFTGLRIAAAVAQGFALASDRPLVAVSSLAGLAQRAWREHGIEQALVCIDARMGEVYWAAFRIIEGLAESRAGESLAAPSAVTAPAPGGFSAVGDAFAAYPETLGALAEHAEQWLGTLVPTARDLLPRARADLAKGLVLDAAAAQPTYLRGADAWKRL